MLKIFIYGDSNTWGYVPTENVYDALVSKRCYKEPYPKDIAIQIIKDESGRHFDLTLVNVFLFHQDDITNI